MASSPSPDNPFAAVIVAAGRGLRVGGAVPKQFASWRGKPVLRHAAEALLAAGAGPILVAIPEGADRLAGEILAGLPGVSFVTGGSTRQASVARALEALDRDATDLPFVLIHDAARPDCPPDVVARLLEALESHHGAIPVLPVVDSVVVAEDDVMGSPVARETLRRVQTPQAFAFAAILAAHRAWQGARDAGDDAQVLRAAGHEVALVAGDERLRKLTFKQDFEAEDLGPDDFGPHDLGRKEFMDRPPSPTMRVGTGYDVHRLAAGEELWLCGVRLEHHQGLAGHSDADVGLHAVVDAILGAVGAGDIGQHFPPSDPRWKGATSSRFVEHAVRLAAQARFAIGNVDVTLVCEAPRIGPHRDAMRAALAAMLGVGVESVSVKATTTEGLGFPGRGEGIAAQAVACLYATSRSEDSR